MGSSHPSPAERLGQNAAGHPAWYRPKGVKTKYDFPKAKPGRPDRLEFDVGERKPGRPRRLDKYLLERFPGYSRSFLQKMIKDGKILINGKTTKASWHVSTGEHVTLLLPEGAKHAGEEIAFEVVYEDEFFIALVKPAGIIVHPARGNKDGTLYNGLLHYFKDRLAADPSYHIGTVHRLDEQTSGIIVFALDKKAHGELTRQFEYRLLSKTYLCLVHGPVDFEARDVDAPLGVDPSMRTRIAVNGLDARPAQTRFETLFRSACGQYALLRAYPRTGRSHQIRVHALEMGHSIVGDELYRGRCDDAAFGDLRPRVCLHAESLTLCHPIHGHPMTLEAPLTEDIAALATRLGITGALPPPKVADPKHSKAPE